MTQIRPELEVDDVAVIGMSCRVAGDSSSPEALWEALLSQKDASGEMPKLRWQHYQSRDRQNPSVLKDTISRGYFLSSLEDFDAAFFGISPMEAEQMDPQQRLSLEVTWEAFQRAGLTASHLSGSSTGVFWGVNSDDYSRLLLEDLPRIQPWMGIGSSYCGVPNRISYHFNLLGPSLAIDAACASSLVAVHYAAQALRLQECDVAVAGGVNALCAPGMFCVLQKAGAILPDGSCRSFDRDACGYGRGEGAGAVVLKRASAALLDGDAILALLKGTAVAQDGKTRGIMAPSAKSQARVARLALKQARLTPAQIGFVEAHATSTPLGDATEFAALQNVYGTDKGQLPNRPESLPCLVGSIKPNIGHLEAGAGIMGLIKAVMCVQKGVVPPQANLTTLSSALDWENSRLQISRDSTTWKGVNGEPRRAAICSYGYGGTVSHAIVEEFQQQKSNHYQNGTTTLGTTGHQVLLLSGRQQKRIPLLAKSLLSYIETARTGFSSQSALARITSTLVHRRDHSEYRAALVVDSLETARESLLSIAECPSAPVAAKWKVQNRVFSASTQRSIVFVFSGHGAQWADMGKQLLHNTLFLDAVSPLDVIVKQEIQQSPLELLRAGHSTSSDMTQILTYIMQIGISQVLHSRGVVPDAIIGHSVGEVAASVVAGALSPEEGVLIVTRRSVLYRTVMSHGAMAMVSKSFEETGELIKSNDNVDLVRAIDASPSSCVVAGPADSLAKATRRWKQEHPLLKITSVKTDIAFHSPVLKKLAEPLAKALQGSLSPRRPTRCKLYSTSCPDPRDQSLRDESYWINNMIAPVQLWQATQAAVEDSYRVFVEISSHPIISHAVSEIMLDRDLDEWSVISTLRRDCDAEVCILSTMSELHCIGVEVDWSQTCSAPWIPDLPVEPWLHQSVWRRPGPCTEATTIYSKESGHDPNTHTLLGRRSYVPGADIVLYSTTLDSACKPFPASHPVLGTEIIPAAVLFNTFLRVPNMCSLEDVHLRTVMALPDGASRAVQVSVAAGEATIASQLMHAERQDDESSWTIHTTSKYKVRQSGMQMREVLDISSLRKCSDQQVAETFSTDYLSSVGVAAMAFPWVVKEHHRGDESMLCRVQTAGNADPRWDPSSWAPIMDAATSVASTIFDVTRLRMPTHVESINVLSTENPPVECWLYIQLRSQRAEHVCDVSILGLDGRALLRLTRMSFLGVEGKAILKDSHQVGRDECQSVESLVHSITWVPFTLATEPYWRPSRFFIITSRADLRAAWISACKEKLGTAPIFVSPGQDLHSTNSALPLESDAAGAAALVYLPSAAAIGEDIGEASQECTWQLLEILKLVCRRKLHLKIFAYTVNAHGDDGVDATALAYAPLVGLCRVLASEHPGQFASLIDGQSYDMASFSAAIDAMTSLQDVDVVRIQDGVPTIARLQPLANSKELAADGPSHGRLLPHAGGTYLITGGLGALGLEVASFLISHGARRLVLVSRRQLPARHHWPTVAATHWSHTALSTIQALEDAGATIHAISVDMAAATAVQDLRCALERLSLPRVTGVVHAAGVVEDQLALETTRQALTRVLAPKIHGALALHSLFPVGSLDFMVFFSSCGQLVGFTGQSSYASGNAFLDALAANRQQQEDQQHGSSGVTISFLWTSWRDTGMVAGSEYIALELESKGITDMTRAEAFAAWRHAAAFANVSHAVVLRARPVDGDGDDGSSVPPLSLLAEISRRVRHETTTKTISEDAAASAPLQQNGNSSSASESKTPQEIRGLLAGTIRACVARVLQVDAAEVDPRSSLADLGVDSVMMVTLRWRLQQALRVKVPPTLIWSYPTVNLMAGWFAKYLA